MIDIINEIINNTKCPGCNILLKDSDNSKCKHGFESGYHNDFTLNESKFIIYFYNFHVSFFGINYKNPSNIMSLTINSPILSQKQIEEIYDMLPNEFASLNTFQSTIDITFKYIENIIFL